MFQLLLELVVLPMCVAQTSYSFLEPLDLRMPGRRELFDRIRLKGALFELNLLAGLFICGGTFFFLLPGLVGVESLVDWDSVRAA